MESKKIAFAALNPYIVDNVLSAEEKEIRGQEFIQYGDFNKYPQYLYDLYLNVPTLQSAINSVVDYTMGDEIICSLDKVNSTDTVEDFIKYITLDYVLYGGFAINVIRNRFGGIAELHHLDFKNIRSDKKNNFFWYSEDWNKKSYGRVKTIKYPKYNKDSKDASSILYYTNTHIQTYPIPMWSASVIGAEMEKRINAFQLNAIRNGFSSSYIVNLNNGTPSEEQQEEIERGFNEKFCGDENSGRLVISYNDNKDNAATIEAVPDDKLVERYAEAVKRAKEEILTAFRCHPSILGIQIEGSGFNDNDTQESFALFNKTVIKPIQKTIVRVFNDLYNDVELEIKPFSIDFGEDGTVNNNSNVKE